MVCLKSKALTLCLDPTEEMNNRTEEDNDGGEDTDEYLTDAASSHDDNIDTYGDDTDSIQCAK